LKVDETAPPSIKASVGGLTQLQIFNGVMASFTLGLGVPEDPAEF
jgi:hypothetical protein